MRIEARVWKNICKMPSPFNALPPNMHTLSSLDVVLTIHAKLSLRHVSLQLWLFSIVQSSSRSAIVCSIDISPRPESRFRQDAVPFCSWGARGRQPPRPRALATGTVAGQRDFATAFRRTKSRCEDRRRKARRRFLITVRLHPAWVTIFLQKRIPRSMV